MPPPEAKVLSLTPAAIIQSSKARSTVSPIDIRLHLVRRQFLR
jgi:hypothetical protein